MMRKELGALIIACTLIGWSAPAVRAQAVGDGPSIRDIVEMARMERDRRAAIQAAREDRIYTTNDVVQYVPPTPESAQAPTVSDADAGIEASAPDTSGESPADGELEMTPEQQWLAWQERVGELRNEIQALEDRTVQLQLQMTEIRGTVTAPTGTLQARNRALADLAVAQSDLDETSAELEAATAELNELLENQPPQP